ncbi:MAG: AMP-binding protein [Kiritimatiellae bacterium]|jgi:long-chain acyl-CoA synthetase|nr:AMP-binding protein [Kiritimatiellia bacterium]NLG00931.1 AMP-binding protein [Lentisphaerota bacterium]
MTLRTLLDDAAARNPHAVALRYRRDQAWQRRSYAELVEGVGQMAEAFSGFHLKPGSEPVALILENGPEWIETYLANAGTGVAVVPLDPKLRACEVAYVLKDSEAVAVFTDTRHLDLLETILPDLPAVRAIIVTDGGSEPLAPIAGRPCYDYEALRESVRGRPPAWYAAHIPVPQDVASIIYTSGTTGKPKGAMLTHLNFCSDALGSFEAIGDMITAKDDFLIVLPLFHAFSFTANFVVPLVKGCGMYFVESLRTVGEDIKTLRPSIFIAVPLLAEKLFAKIDDKLKCSAVARGLLKIGLGPLIGKKVLKGLGGRLRFLIVGGAPCPIHVLQGFRKLGVPIVEGYGLTECSPVVSISNIRQARIGTIGKKLPNIEIRLADTNEQGVGELQVRGPIVMKGYFKNIAATREAFDGDWLRTGDLASIDAEGFLTIRGRKKALIVNREGKNIYPEEVENVIARDPLIADVIVVGYTVGRVPGERVGAIITPDLEAVAAAHAGTEPPWPKVEQLIRNRVHAQCACLADYKHPRKIIVQREPLERTSIQKVRRCVYQDQLNE